MYLGKDRTTYENLVDYFSKAKIAGDYITADIFREELRKWQSGLSDQDFINMYKTGHYTFHPYFEDYQHQRKRLGQVDP